MRVQAARAAAHFFITDHLVAEAIDADKPLAFQSL